MKLNVNLKTTVLGKNKKAYEYNGRNGVSYKAVCMVNDNGNTVTDKISVTEEVFHSLEDMKPYDLYGYVDSKYKKILIERAVLMK